MSNIVSLAPVQGSSNVAAQGYDPSSQTLALQYHSGATHHYAGVGADDYDALMNAKSMGSHVARVIVPNFVGTRVDDPSAVA